jgi:alkaline phosphatase
MARKVRRIALLIAIFMVIAVWLPLEVLAAGPKNVVYLIGDGMSATQRRAPEEVLGRKLVMNTFPAVGLYTTYCLDTLVTDSAAAGTALATGHKTNSGVISVDPTGKVAYETLAEAAKRLGKSVGLVTTTAITDATPAVFGAHIIDRAQQNEIAEQYLEQGFAVYMGGGLRHFIPQSEKGSKRKDDRDLTHEFADAGYSVVKNKGELGSLEITKNTKVLGLFSQSNMPHHVDRSPDHPTLSEMTAAAIKVLKQNPKGFFLMVEGGRVDHGCHANDPVAAIFDTEELDRAVTVAVDFQKEDPDTFIFVGGDHETGGMGLGIGLDYFVKPEVVRNGRKTYEWVAGTFSKKGGDPVAVLSEATGIDDFTPEEVKAINMAAENVKVKKKSANAYNPNWLAFVYADIMSRRSHIGWTSWAHTASPVVVTCAGPGSENFVGYYDNTDPARKLAALWGIELKTWNVQ